ncbi:AAA family ATPase [Patulibacter sp.]|uniref:ATP-binding protein n=1 Tax=Patulibacter sp. TaxID=1912859 RepID=UPI0027248D5C|nr:AAA family ATPase [Patulibacter sp.]MDO9407130.1 AAA family ATPase [Patulibacter sp.]
MDGDGGQRVTGLGGAARPLLDRDAETGLLREAVRDVLDGVGRLVVVEGPGGIGKSRLLDEAAELFLAGSGSPDARPASPWGGTPHRRAVRVLRAAGDELHRLRALGLVRDLRDDAGRPPRPEPADDRTWDPDAPEPAPDGGAAAVQGVLADLRGIVGRGGVAAGLLLLDDLHWADAGSLRVLEELAATLERLPLLIVVATRPHEPGAFHVLLDRLRARAGGAYLRPAPLSDDAVARMAVDAATEGAPSRATLDRLVRRSGGNPFYVRELLRTGPADGDADAVPDAVRHAVRVDLGRLVPAATALARAVAVLGAGPDLRLAAAVAELEAREAESAADGLASAAILRPGEPLTFEHALIAEAVRDGLDPFARARLHRRAATLLDARGAPVETVAAHLLEARADGDPWVAGVLMRAARATNAAGDPVAAGRLLERARREPPPPELEGAVMGALAEADALAGRPDAADRLHEALGLIDDPRRRAELRHALGRAFHLAQRFDDAARTSKDALDGLPVDDPLYDRVLAGWLTDAMFVPDLRPTEDPRVTAVTEDIRAGGKAAGPLVAHAVNIAALDGAPSALVADLARRATSLDPVTDSAAHGFPLTHVTTGLVHADLLDEAVAILSRAGDWAIARHNVLAEMTALGGRSFASRLRGELAPALADAERAFEISRATDTPYSAWWLLVLVDAHLDAGDVERARAAFEQSREVTIPAYALLRLREAEAAILRAEGDPESAIAVAESGEAERLRIGGLRLALGTREGRWSLARSLMAVGRHDEALRVADGEVERTVAAPVARHRADALMLAGIVRGADGVPQLDRAVALLRPSPARLLLLRGLTALGLARRDAGDAVGARTALLEALELADGLRLRRRSDELLAHLRTVGARPRRAARHGREALTTAELEVARLAAEGLGNPAIAARRHVSRKTVETHLGRAYRKLGIESRDGLRAALDDAGDGATGPLRRA